MCSKPSGAKGDEWQKSVALSCEKVGKSEKEENALTRTHQYLPGFSRPFTPEGLALLHEQMAEVFNGVTQSFAMTQTLIQTFSEEMTKAAAQITKAFTPVVDEIAGIVKFSLNRYDMALYRMGIIDIEGNYVGEDNERRGNDKS